MSLVVLGGHKLRHLHVPNILSHLVEVAHIASNEVGYDPLHVLIWFEVSFGGNTLPARRTLLLVLPGVVLYALLTEFVGAVLHIEGLVEQLLADLAYQSLVSHLFEQLEIDVLLLITTVIRRFNQNPGSTDSLIEVEEGVGVQ